MQLSDFSDVLLLAGDFGPLLLDHNELEEDTGEFVGVICIKPEGDAGAVFDFFLASKKYGDSSCNVGPVLRVKEGSKRSSKDLFLLR